jgi:DNA modification methylase
MEEVKLYNGDARQLFSLIDDETIDCIVTDPPYEVISGGAQEND